MIDLCITGTLEKDIVVFSVDGETKTIDQFSNHIHFSLEEKKIYRIQFEQKSEQFVPRYAEVMLNILFFPVRGIFNILTFNNVQNWEKDISAFKVSGYIDISLNKDTEISFDLRHGEFDKDTNKFQRPIISFDPSILIEQLCSPDAKEIIKKHQNHLLNIGSASVLLLALLFYLIFIGVRNEIYVACIFTLILLIAFGVLIAYLLFHSFKKKNSLLTALEQQSEHQ